MLTIPTENHQDNQKQQMRRYRPFIRSKIIKNLGTELPQSAQKKERLITLLEDEANYMLMRKKKSIQKSQKIQQLSTQFENKQKIMADRIEEKMKKSQNLKKRALQSQMSRLKYHAQHFNKILQNNQQKSQKLILNGLQRQQQFYNSIHTQQSSLFPHQLKTTTSTRQHNITRHFEQQLIQKQSKIIKKQQHARKISEQQKNKIISQLKEHKERVQTIKARSRIQKIDNSESQKIQNYITKIQNARKNNHDQYIRVTTDRKKRLQAKLQRLKSNISIIQQLHQQKILELNSKFMVRIDQIQQQRRSGKHSINSSQKKFSELLQKEKGIKYLQKIQEAHNIKILEKHRDMSLQNKVIKKGRTQLLYDIVSQIGERKY